MSGMPCRGENRRGIQNNGVFALYSDLHDLTPCYNKEF